MSHNPLIGKEAPSFTLPNYDGQDYSLNPGEGGLPIALFFYPKSSSFGCTKEACQFRDAVKEKENFKPEKVRVIGVSRDPVDKQKEFVEREKLNYPVLSDMKGEATSAYHVGKGMLGMVDVARVTFVIDKKGVVRDSLDATLNYAAHSKWVGKWLDKLEEEEKSGTKEPEGQKAAAEPAKPATAEQPVAAPTTAAEQPAATGSAEPSKPAQTTTTEQPAATSTTKTTTEQAKPATTTTEQSKPAAAEVPATA